MLAGSASSAARQLVQRQTWPMINAKSVTRTVIQSLPRLGAVSRRRPGHLRSRAAISCMMARHRWRRCGGAGRDHRSASAAVRTPPDALTPSRLPTNRRIRAMSATVAPPPLKPVEVLTKLAPASFGNHTGSHFLLIGQQPGLDDDLEQQAILLRGVGDRGDVALDGAIVAVAQAAHRSTMSTSWAPSCATCLDFIGFDRRQRGAQRKTDHGAGLDGLPASSSAQSGAQVGLTQTLAKLYVNRFGAEGAHLFFARLRFEQRVVDQRASAAGRHDVAGARPRALPLPGRPAPASPLLPVRSSHDLHPALLSCVAAALNVTLRRLAQIFVLHDAQIQSAARYAATPARLPNPG
jgi:hypothetical protein